MEVRNASARRERARERARRDILLASAEVFARRGYAAATLADLAESAGYAAASLYRYFESKEQIYRSIFELFVEEFSATFEAPADRSLPLGERLAALLRAQVRLAEVHRPLLPVLASPSPEVACTFAGQRVGDPGAGIAFYEQRFLAWLGANASARELRGSRQQAAQVVAGIAYAFLHRVKRQPSDLTAEIPRIVDLALHGIAGAAAPPSSNGTQGAHR